MALLQQARALLQSVKSSGGSAQPAQSAAPAANETAHVKPLVHASRSLAASADSLSAFAKNSIDNMEAVSLATHQIVHSIGQQSKESERSLDDSGRLGSLLQRSSEHMGQMTGVIRHTIQASRHGETIVGRLAAESADNIDIAQLLAEHMKQLEEKSQSISGAIQIITGVSRQIQLLALNASIEAAHAGEHGKGFDVVAQEIRRLAQDSGSGADRVRSLLGSVLEQVAVCGDIVKRTLESSKQVSHAVTEANEAFRSIDGNLRSVTATSEQVQASMEQAQQAKDDVIQSIHTITALAQETLSSSTEIAYMTERQASTVLSVAGASEDLQSISGEIKRNVGSMVVIGGGSSDTDEKTLVIGFMPNLSHAPALLASGTGLFADRLEGKYEIRLFTAGPALVHALVNKQIHVGYTGPGPVFDAQAAGHPVRIVAGASQGGAALLVSPQSGIREPGQLGGKRIAVPQYGNGQHILLKHLLHEHGLKDVFRGGDIRIVQMKPSAIGAAFDQGQLDAALVQEPWISLLESTGQARVLVDWKQLLDDGTYPNTVVAVHEESIERYGDRLDRFMAAHREALAAIGKGRAEVFQQIAGELQRLVGQSIPSAELNRALSRILWKPDIDAVSLQSFLEVAQREGFVKNGVRVGELLRADAPVLSSAGAR